MYLDSLIEGYTKRLISLTIFAIATFAILEYSLWNIQTIDSSLNHQRIDRQSLRKVRTSPVRGRMLTSDGIVVVDNQPVFDAILHTFEMRQPGARSKTLTYIAKQVMEMSKILYRPADVFTKAGLLDVAKEQFNFDYQTFKTGFWSDKGQQQVKEDYFKPFLDKSDQSQVIKDSWRNYFYKRHYLDGIELEVSYNYRRMFNKIANAKRITDRLYDRLLQKLNGQITIDLLWTKLRKSNKQRAEVFELFSSSELISAFGGYDEGVFEKKDGAYTVKFKKQTHYGAKTQAIFKSRRSIRALQHVKNGTIISIKLKKDKSEIVATLVEEDQAYVDLIKRDLSKSEPLPYVAFSGLDDLAVGRLSEMQHTLPGLELRIREDRIYPRNTFAAHILGKTGRRLQEDFEKEEKELNTENHKYYDPELKGRDGLELFYEDDLRGSPGTKMILVDYRGNSRQLIQEDKTQNGYDLLLNIDSKAQDAAEEALEIMHEKTGKNGTVILLNVNTGAVLAMASYPTYNINAFDYSALIKDKSKPLLNRAISEQYTPGSVIKPVIAMAAFQSGAANPDTTNNCTGKFYCDEAKKTKPIRCWIGRAPYYSSHGELNVVEALERSCNPFFSHIGTLTGVDKITPYLQNAGFGKKTGLDIRYGMTSGEARGVIPTAAYRKRNRLRWNIADTARLSIGQGAIAVTPIQVATYVAAIANGGKVYQPHLVKAVAKANGEIVRTIKPIINSKLGINPLYMDYIKEGMRRVVWGERREATARAVQHAPIELAGKTGSAQVTRPLKIDGKNIYEADGKLKFESFTNTWFMCFGPLVDPKYACVVLVERGRSGGSTAAPVAIDLFRIWMDQK